MARSAASRLASFTAREWAIVLVAIALAIALASAIVPVLRICHDRLANTGDAGVSTLCEPILSEPSTLALFGLLVVLIILPLLSKFDVAGLFSVELKDLRRTAEAAKESADLAKQIAKLADDQAVNATRQAADVRTLQREIQRLQDQLVIRVGVIESGSLAASHARRILEAESLAGADPQTDQLTGRFLSIWQEIEPWAFINKRGAKLGVTSGRARGLRPDGRRLNPVQRQAVEQWRRLFGFEIDFVSKTRNTLVNEPEALRADDLRAALETANLVKVALDQALG